MSPDGSTRQSMAMSTASLQERTLSNPAWNTRRLGSRLGVDIASAVTAGALTCPIVTIIDRAIMERASKGYPIRQTLASCLRSMASRPVGFLVSTPFLLIYTLYTSTYLTANTIDTLTSTLRNQPFSTVFPGTAKFLTTTTVNMGLCVFKDARFAKMFGAQKPSSSSSVTTPKVPKISYSLFCLRDSVTVFASFNIPPLIAHTIPDAIAPTYGMKAAMAQFACPALMQFISTPMHLLGLDLYNRQPAGGLPWYERAARVKRDYISSSFARMGKIVPAFGVGGVVNVRMRAELMHWLERNDSVRL